MKYKTIIFDLDGTLLDTSVDLMNSVNYAMESMNYPLKTKEEILSNLGYGSKELIKRSMPFNEIDKLNETHNIFRNHYSLHSTEYTALYPGILDVVIYLKNKGFNLAIVSNKPDKNVKELNSIYLKELIPLAIGQSEDIAKKPAKDMLIKAMEYYNSNLSDTLFIGDSEVDVLTAINAEVDNLSVTWGFRTITELMKSGAVNIINYPKEIIEYIYKTII